MAKLKNIPLVLKMIGDKYINIQKHSSTVELYQLNYSHSCQADHVWNEATLQCRGIIVDGDMNIVSRPFEKFYNMEELVEMGVEIPNLPFDVFEKMDGSLGIMYWIGDTPYLATRGSFKSEQALHGTEILHTKYKDVWNRFDKSKTYLFEIIYPEDKHCIDYHGEIDDIYLLAVIDTETGEETDSIDNYRDCLSVTKHYEGIKDWRTIREEFDGTNREGFVIRFSNGFRMKLKYEEYFKIHFMRSYLTKKTIFEHILAGTLDEIEERLSYLDEENVLYYKKLKKEIYDRYSEIEKEFLSIYRERGMFESPKEYAEWALKQKGWSSMIFQKEKGVDYSQIIWKMIKREIKDENKGSIYDEEE